jgi:predicted Fe-Mo cluster-binding NifX family protein
LNIMKIAIPLFNNRISPRFDCARDFLLALAENGRVVKREAFPAVLWSPLERVKRLKEMGVDTLICGGIDEISLRRLNFYNIKAYSYVTGLAEDALQSLLRGELESCAMIGPGGRCSGIWRFRSQDSDGEYKPGGRGKGRRRSRGRGGGYGSGRGSGFRRRP